MSDSKTTVSGGPSGMTLLQLLFIGLKLTGYITWSWWWVMSPIWIPLLFIAVVCLGIAIAYGLGPR